MVQNLFCLYSQHPGLFPLAVCFDALVESLIAILFHLGTDKMKVAHGEQIF